jgi:hypothetical protein
VSDVPEASPVKRGRTRGVGYHIGSRRTEGGFGRADGNEILSYAPEIPLGAALEEAAGDAVRDLSR